MLPTAVIAWFLMHRIETSLAEIASAAEAATSAPASMNGCALSGDRFHTVTDRPLAKSVLAITLPIWPNPRTELSDTVTPSHTMISNFEGYAPLLTRRACERKHVCHVSFEPGGRNKLYTHIYEQMLFVTGGRGIIADNYGVHVVEPGDLIVIPAGEPHWHGATESDSISHLCIESHNNEITIVE